MEDLQEVFSWDAAKFKVLGAIRVELRTAYKQTKVNASNVIM